MTPRSTTTRASTHAPSSATSRWARNDLAGGCAAGAGVECVVEPLGARELVRGDCGPRLRLASGPTPKGSGPTLCSSTTESDSTRRRSAVTSPRSRATNVDASTVMNLRALGPAPAQPLMELERRARLSRPPSKLNATFRRAWRRKPTLSPARNAIGSMMNSSGDTDAVVIGV
jgi:hypothetical protein